MSDPRMDALAESARNRGLKLVRSRVRTPGKRRFGKVGLTDPSGKSIYGIDAKGPTAKPEEIEDYLRNLGSQDWGASLGVAASKRKKASRRAAPKDAGPSPRAPTPKPEAKPQPKIREAKPADVPRLVELMALLGHQVDPRTVRKRIAALAKDDVPQLVATLGKEVVGLIGLHLMSAIHREQPVGRITILVVAKEARGRGLGRTLVEAGEERLRKLGCGMAEVTSNDRLTEAHAFYRHMDYERSSIRFFKKL